MKSLNISNGNDVRDLARNVFYGRRLENMELLLPTLMHVIDEVVKLDKFEVRARGSATEINKIKPKDNYTYMIWILNVNGRGVGSNSLTVWATLTFKGTQVRSLFVQMTFDIALQGRCAC